MKTPENCPNCGADVPSGARACPECGADEETGWSEEAAVGNLGIPEDSFNYEDYVKREFGGESSAETKRAGKWKMTAVVLLLLLGFPVIYFVIVTVLGKGLK
jgi:hypothetical protein